jgi:4-hydroxythreonine-4-phosphate dehydrogenase
LKLVDIDNVANPGFGANPDVSGRASTEYLDAAFAAYREGQIDGLVTGPIHKESWHAAGFRHPGQTEYCAEKTDTAEYCMLMSGRSFRIALLSTHYSLRQALDFVNRDEIERRIRFLDREFKKLGFARPRIGVAALNPHAGEAGAFGSEDLREIRPAVEASVRAGIDVEGPIAPEIIFRKAARSKTRDVILAMYHDQAMIPLKLINFEQSANVTLGLPLIRTSPDHGTAFDIAGKGKANPASMIYAIRIAADWTARRIKAERA